MGLKAHIAVKLDSNKEYTMEGKNSTMLMMFYLTCSIQILGLSFSFLMLKLAHRCRVFKNRTIFCPIVPFAIAIADFKHPSYNLNSTCGKINEVNFTNT